MKDIEIRELFRNTAEYDGKEVTVYIDRPIGSRHTKYSDIVYEVNYGYIKEIVAPDNEYQDAYLLGVDTKVKQYRGKVYAIVERGNDNEDKLIVIANDKEYTLEEINKFINFQEKYFIYKIIR